MKDKVKIKAPFEKLLQMEILEAKKGKAKVKMPCNKDFTNPAGMMHGGAIASLIDTALAVGLSTLYKNDNFFTAKLEVKFKRPIKRGKMVATSNIIGRKGSFSFGEIRVENEKGDLVATGKGTFYIP